jgi:Kdo2-lipid IVA lauroyltransferase/acyltransferase
MIAPGCGSPVDPHPAFVSHFPVAARPPKFSPPLDAVLTTLARAAMVPITTVGFANAMEAARGLARVYCALDKKHVDRAKRNIRDAYPDLDEPGVRELAVRCHEHVFQLGVEFAYTPRLLNEQTLTRTVTYAHMHESVRALLDAGPIIMITGHIGNWELMGSAISMLGFPICAVYRPLDLRGVDHWVQRMRNRHGLYLISKFGAAKGVPAALEAGFPIGLVADQSGGDRGVFTPFFGRLTSTYKMIGLAAMRYNATIICGAARRLAVGERPLQGAWSTTTANTIQEMYIADPTERMRFGIEVHDVYGPKDWMGQPDPLFYVTARYRRAMEAMVRRSPEQYFWMHRIWRSRPAHERDAKPFPKMLREKLASLPWMTDTELERLIAQSDRDTAALAHAGKNWGR